MTSMMTASARAAEYRKEHGISTLDCDDLAKDVNNSLDGAYPRCCNEKWHKEDGTMKMAHRGRHNEDSTSRPAQ